MKLQHAYRLSFDSPDQHYLKVEYFIEGLEADFIQLQLPVWRPGRYELGNFAKNVVKFQVEDNNSNALKYNKISTHQWEVSCRNVAALKVSYFYYAADLNAGSTFLSGSQLYVNPVNCLIYMPELLEEPISLFADVPDHFLYAGSCELADKNKVNAPNLHELFDSPFIFSPSLKSMSLRVNDTLFHLHFQGHAKFDKKQVENDFSRFIAHQMELFGDFPVPEYHFLFQMLNQSYHHGVEHTSSTVLAMGPAYAQFTTGYSELLGICSHELYHTWNIKAIRPAEWLPYDYTKENYGVLGYVAEGVTTLMGDLVLLRSGVWSDSDFWMEFQKELQKHFDNFGRFNYSVSQSAFDSWLDGYSAGVPKRKVSIYTEGMMYAFALDMLIFRKSNHRFTLNTVMRNLYERFAKQGKGYTEEDYIAIVSELAQEDVRPFFEQYIWNANDDFELLRDSLAYLDWELSERPSALYHERTLGMRISASQQITAIYPGSVAEEEGLWLDDKLLAVNGVEGNDLVKWIEFFGDEPIELHILRQHQLIRIKLPPTSGRNERGFKQYFLQRSKQESVTYNEWKTKIQ
ncbi:MAG TPA: hypothetical protein VFV37_10400 [Luteibaculaceae bacterium]|nr:hypothetical protein [Luteibaculaceae bacterium]